jgi:hypothetical protein
MLNTNYSYTQTENLNHQFHIPHRLPHQQTLYGKITTSVDDPTPSGVYEEKPEGKEYK